jgi:hypothetical protein
MITHIQVPQNMFHLRTLYIMLMPNNLMLVLIWKGFPQYYEFDFYRPNITDQHITYEAKSAYTYNWTYYVSYA